MHRIGAVGFLSVTLYLGVDSPVCSTIVLFNDQLFPWVFDGFLKRWIFVGKVPLDARARTARPISRPAASPSRGWAVAPLARQRCPGGSSGESPYPPIHQHDAFVGHVEIIFLFKVGTLC